MFEVSFNSPQCGWMSIGFADGKSEFHTTTAHAPYEGALAELMRILTKMTDSRADDIDFTLKWNRDPEGYDFHISRKRGELSLKIYEFPTEERAGESKLVYAYTGEIRPSLAAFAQTFEQLYADRHTDDFEINWRQPFPVAEFEAFKKALAAS